MRLLLLALATVLFLACSDEQLPDTQREDIAPFADQATAQPTQTPPPEAAPPPPTAEPPPPPQPTLAPPPAPEPTSAATLPPPQSDCDPAYPTTCIPSPPPDLDCGDVAARRFEVLPPDPHGFDSDFDGVGCESG